MKLLVDSLSETPSPFRFEATPAWFAERFPADARPAEGLTEPIDIAGRAYRAAADLLIEGTLRGGVELTCSRCLKRFRAPLREAFRLVLEPAGSRVPADPDGAAALAEDGLYLADDAETGWFRGHTLRLDRYLGEILALALPMQPICKDDCAGLCPRCGVDRNEESCNCAESRPDSPFAVLGKLKKGGQAQ